MASQNGFGPQITTGKPGRKPQGPQAAPQSPQAPSVSSEAPPVPARKDLPAKPVRSLGHYRGAPMTTEQQQALHRWSRKARQGPVSHLPMICKGPECPFVHQCPLVKEGVAEPIGEECPVEDHLRELWVADFLEGLGVDEAHPDFPVVQALVSDLSFDLLIQNRFAWTLANDPDPVRKEVIGINNNGSPIEVQKVNPGLEFLNRLGTKKIKLLREILATPRSKAEAGRMGWKDPGTQAASAQAKAEKLKELAGRKKGDEDLSVRLAEIRLGEDDPDDES